MIGLYHSKINTCGFKQLGFWGVRSWHLLSFGICISQGLDFFGSGVPTGIFKAMDDSGDGLLSEEEMSEWLLDESHLIFWTVFFGDGKPPPSLITSMTGWKIHHLKMYTPENQHGSWKSTCLTRNIMFQSAIFRFHVSFSGCISYWRCAFSSQSS